MDFLSTDFTNGLNLGAKSDWPEIDTSTMMEDCRSLCWDFEQPTYDPSWRFDISRTNSTRTEAFTIAPSTIFSDHVLQVSEPNPSRTIFVRKRTDSSSSITLPVAPSKPSKRVLKEPKIFQCSLCESAFSRNHDLKRHVRYLIDLVYYS